jgi:hypothetical protein
MTGHRRRGRALVIPLLKERGWLRWTATNACGHERAGVLLLLAFAPLVILFAFSV